MAHPIEVVHQPGGGTGHRFEARTQGHAVIMDSGAGRVAMSPVETLLAALGGCGGMDVIDLLRKKRQEVTEYKVVVDGVRAETHPRIFTRLTVRHVITGRGLSATAVADAIRLSDEKYCTVHAMLKGVATIESSFELHEAGASS
jgi:putative redox protein